MPTCASSGVADATSGTDLTLPGTVVAARTCIIVAGMHRSGTSATARVINLLGADIASDLIPAIGGENERGFWESNKITHLHDGLLIQLGSTWHDPFPLADGWLETAEARGAKRAIIEHVEKEFAGSRAFVVKDPRLTRVLPLWLEISDDLALSPLIVIPFRNPLAVAASLEQRDGLSLPHALLVYIQGNLEVERASRGRRRIFHLYDDLISDWRGFAAKLVRAGGASTNKLTPETAAAIDDFLSADLQHHRVSRESLAELPDAAATLAEMHDAMMQAAATGEETALRACFDRVREHAGETAKLFRALAMARADDYRSEIARVEGRMASECERRDGELGALRSRLAEREAQVELLTATLQEREAYIEETTAALRQREERIEEMTGELHRRDAKLEEIAAQVHEREAAVERTTNELRERSAELSGLHVELHALTAGLTEAKQKQVLAEQEISSVLGSTSWRMTAPLRALGRLGRALYRR